MIASLLIIVDLARISLALLQISIALAAYPKETATTSNAPVLAPNSPQEAVSIQSGVLSSLKILKNLDRADIEGIIKREANVYGVNPKLALYLAQIESNFVPTAKNPSSSALGLFQHIDQTWIDYCDGERTNATDSAKCTMKMISSGGISHWTADPIINKKLKNQGFIE